MQATTLERSARDRVTPSIVTRQPPRRRLAASRTFYLAVSLSLLAAVVIGFWPTYFGPLLAGTPALRPMVKVHAPVFLGWIVLLLAQTALALVGRVDLHRKLGWLGVAYAAVIVAVGLLMAADTFSARVALGEV